MTPKGTKIGDFKLFATPIPETTKNASHEEMRLVEKDHPWRMANTIDRQKHISDDSYKKNWLGKVHK